MIWSLAVGLEMVPLDLRAAPQPSSSWQSWLCVIGLGASEKMAHGFKTRHFEYEIERSNI